MLKAKTILEYVKEYTSEMASLVSKIPEETHILLPDHLVSNQEIDIYITKETGVVVDYVGLSLSQKITIRGSNKCFDDLIFPSTESKVPCNQGALRIHPLKKTNDNEPVTTPSFLGDMAGIVLFRITGGGHLFAYDKQAMENNFGRHVIFNIYVQREHSDGSIISRYVRYAELYPDKKELFTLERASLNARKDLADFLNLVSSPKFGPPVQKYVRIGEAIHQLKEKSVIVLGKETPLLRRIRDELRTMNYNSFLAKEQPDIAGQSPEEKVKLFALMSKFAVMEDSVASGHLPEFEYCKNNRVVLALLRQKGKGSTWMVGEAPLVDINYIKSFEYDEKSLHDVLFEASKWAESFIQRRADAYKNYFPWSKK